MPDSDVDVLVHLLGDDEYTHARGQEYWAPASLAEVGFVHLSTPRQVHLPANRFYRARTDLVALWVDVSRIDGEIRWEAGLPDDPVDMRFPHLYAPLPLESVISSQRYLPDGSGVFAPLG